MGFWGFGDADGSCRAYLLLSLALCLPLAWPQTTRERLTVGQPAKVVGKRNAAVQTRIPLTIQPGFHVTGQHPSDEYMIPLTLDLDFAGCARRRPGDLSEAEWLEKYDFDDEQSYRFSPAASS